jgi:hypothetical protein
MSDIYHENFCLSSFIFWRGRAQWGGPVLKSGSLRKIEEEKISLKLQKFKNRKKFFLFTLTD